MSERIGFDGKSIEYAVKWMNWPAEDMTCAPNTARLLARSAFGAATMFISLRPVRAGGSLRSISRTTRRSMPGSRTARSMTEARGLAHPSSSMIGTVHFAFHDWARPRSKVWAAVESCESLYEADLKIIVNRQNEAYPSYTACTADVCVERSVLGYAPGRWPRVLFCNFAPRRATLRVATIHRINIKRTL